MAGGGCPSYYCQYRPFSAKAVLLLACAVLSSGIFKRLFHKSPTTCVILTFFSVFDLWYMFTIMAGKTVEVSLILPSCALFFELHIDMGKMKLMCFPLRAAQQVCVLFKVCGRIFQVGQMKKIRWSIFASVYHEANTSNGNKIRAFQV